MGNVSLAIFLSLGLVFFSGSRLAFSGVCREYAELITNGSYGIADQEGNVIAGCNLDSAYIPASLIKIVTALASFRLLGADYRFVTEFYLGKGGELYIQGRGDPLLLSEDVNAIVNELQALGLRHVNGLYVDQSLFTLDGLPPGSTNSDNAYDAPIAATAVNFNSLPLRIGSSGTVASAEPQTPFLPMMKAMAKGRGQGKYRLNICTGGCRPATVAGRYAIELFQAFMNAAGITISNGSGLKTVPADATLLFRYRNPRKLDAVVRSMLHYSSNFIANQLFLTCGAQVFGYPATWAKGERAVRSTLAAALSDEGTWQMAIVDGAGLSRQNRVSGRTMLRILRVFAPYRSSFRSYKGVHAKTGTLQGVYNFAGYFASGDPYVILLNQERNTRSRLLDCLKNRHLHPELTVYQRGTKNVLDH